jgi:hypothetical protein
MPRARTFSVAITTWCFIAGCFACGDHPGGTVGDPCESRGATDECASDEVCDATDDGSLYCLQLCSDHDDCASGEACNGVSKGSLKACHPKSEDDLDSGDDCAFDDSKCK